MIQLPYVYADLLQLYRHFYSPVDNGADGDEKGGAHVGMPPPWCAMGFVPGLAPDPTTGSPPPTKHQPSGLQCKISSRGLHDVMMGQQGGEGDPLRLSLNFGVAENSCKRGPASDQSM